MSDFGPARQPYLGPARKTHVHLSFVYSEEVERQARNRAIWHPRPPSLGRAAILRLYDRALRRATAKRKPYDPRIRPVFDPLAPTMGPWGDRR